MAHMVKGRQYNKARSMPVHAMPQSSITEIVWRAKRNKNQSATLRALPRNIATWTPQYYAVGVTTSSDSDPVILRGLRQRGV